MEPKSQPYQCPTCGSTHFVVKFAGVYITRITKSNAGYYGQTYGNELNGTENTINCAECKTSITVPVFF